MLLLGLNIKHVGLEVINCKTCTGYYKYKTY